MIAQPSTTKFAHRHGRRRPCAVFVAIRTFALANSRLLIMQALLDRGWRVIAVGNGDEHVGALTGQGVEFHELPFARGSLNPRRDFAAYRTLQRCYAEFQPDLIHHFHAKPVILGCLAARAHSSAAMVNTITGLGHAFIEGGFSHRLSKVGYRMALARADLTVFLNPDDRALFIESGLVRAETTELINGSGVDLQKYRMAGGNGNGTAEAPRVLMLSRLLWEKGVGEFVEAARMCKQSFPHARFQIAGEFYLDHPNAITKEQVDAMVREGAVEYLGYLRNVESVLPDVTLVVLPSYREGVPRTLLEASACGIPTVATDVAGCREAVVDGVNGLLVPPRQAAPLAQAIAALLQDESRRTAMGAAGRKLVEEKFDVQVICQRNLDIYRRLGVEID